MFNHLNSKKYTSGFTLVEIMIVLGIMTIVVMIALPTWVRQREIARAHACQENLMKIDQCKELYALEAKLPNGHAVSMSDLVRDNKTGYLKFEPACNAGGSYSVNPVGVDPTCSFFGSEMPKLPTHRI